MKNTIRAFAPATVANVACGFDVFGFAVDGPGDLVTARRCDTPGVHLKQVTGDGGRLPREAMKNTCGVAASWLLCQSGVPAEANVGVELELEKRMPLASGLGSSAASAVASVVAVDALLGLDQPRRLLLAAAVEGERFAVGSNHADNAAASLYGGFVLVRTGSTPEVVQLPVPDGLTCVIVRPDAEVHTGEARTALGKTVGLDRAAIQWGNTAALVAGLFRGDHELIRSALVDVVAEPIRSLKIPGFHAIQDAAVEAGALGCSISGSGPSIFALCASPDVAENVSRAMTDACDGEPADVLVSRVGVEGAHVLEEGKDG